MKISFKKNKNIISNTYDLAIKQLIFSTNNVSKSYININNINPAFLLSFFVTNTKKSSKSAQFLPSVVFLLVSLMCFSGVFFSQKLSHFWDWFENENAKLILILFGIIFLILSIVLIVQKYILGIKVVFINTGYKKGYHNISKNKYNEIITLLNKLIIEKLEV